LALLILVLAGFLDGIDGSLARKLNQKSSIGAYPIPSPTSCCSSSFVILAMENHAVVADHHDLVLNFAAGGGRVIILISGYRPFPPSLLGKATTFFSDYSGVS
jgi:hypothetical protein